MGRHAVKKKRRFLPKHVTVFVDRHGKERLRFRRAGVSHYFKAPLGTEAFREEYQACLVQAPEKVAIGVERIEPGTFADLIYRYYMSSKWLGKTEKARDHDRRIIEAFRAGHGHRTVKGLTYEFAEKIIGAKASTPTAANKLRKILRRLGNYAVSIKMRHDNPFLEVDRIKITSKGYHEWTEEEIAQYQERHPYGTKARLAMELLLWTGQRRSDGRLIGKQKIKDGRIKVVQAKTGAELWIPVAPQLVKAITSMKELGAFTYLVTSYGKPFTAAGFGNKMREWCDEAKLPQCSAHGLRKAMARRLGDLGMSTLALKAIGGWLGDSEIRKYTQGVNQKALADAAIAELSKWEMSNHAARLDKTGEEGTDNE